MCRTTKFQGSNQRLTNDLSNKNSIFIFFIFTMLHTAQLGPTSIWCSHTWKIYTSILLEEWKWRVLSLNCHLVLGNNLYFLKREIPQAIKIYQCHLWSKIVHYCLEKRRLLVAAMIWFDTRGPTLIHPNQSNYTPLIQHCLKHSSWNGIDMCNICIYIFYQMDGQDPLNNTTFPKP